jgi:hypothetical protein
MKEEWKLSRTEQCKKCPWRVETNPLDIPYGYNVEKHKKLKCTISSDITSYDYLVEHFRSNELKLMACHESSNEDPTPCIGWLYNQLNQGNNIPLRINMRRCTNLSSLKLIGEQHQRFEDTLPDI